MGSNDTTQDAEPRPKFLGMLWVSSANLLRLIIIAASHDGFSRASPSMSPRHWPNPRRSRHHLRRRDSRPASATTTRQGEGGETMVAPLSAGAYLALSRAAVTLASASDFGAAN